MTYETSMPTVCWFFFPFSSIGSSLLLVLLLAISRENSATCWKLFQTFPRSIGESVLYLVCRFLGTSFYFCCFFRASCRPPFRPARGQREGERGRHPAATSTLSASAPTAAARIPRMVRLLRRRPPQRLLNFHPCGSSKRKPCARKSSACRPTCSDRKKPA